MGILPEKTLSFTVHSFLSWRNNTLVVDYFRNFMLPELKCSDTTHANSKLLLAKRQQLEDILTATDFSLTPMKLQLTVILILPPERRSHLLELAYKSLERVYSIVCMTTFIYFMEKRFLFFPNQKKSYLQKETCLFLIENKSKNKIRNLTKCLLTKMIVKTILKTFNRDNFLTFSIK